MALKGIYRITFFNLSNPPYEVGDVLRVYYNDFTLAEYVTLQLRGSSVENVVFTGVELGPKTTTLTNGTVVNNYIVSNMNDSGEVSNSPHQRCESGDLITYEFLQ